MKSSEKKISDKSGAAKKSAGTKSTAKKAVPGSSLLQKVKHEDIRVIGHDDVLRFFSQVYRDHHLGHAYLFLGPRGVGKYTTALALSQLWLCQNPKLDEMPFQPCQQCADCALWRVRAHPDLIIMQKPEDTLEMPIESIRNLASQLALKPIRCPRRIAILDQADLMNESSANAFLKTLEEPPAHSILILIGGSSREQHLATILSRCQIISFSPLNKADIKNYLRQNGEIQIDRIEKILELSGGSIGRAVQLSSDPFWKFREELLHLLATYPVPGLQLGKYWLQFVQSAGSEGSKQRECAHVTIQIYIDLLRSAVLLAVNGAQEKAVANSVEASKIKEISMRYTPDQLLEWMDQALRADFQIDAMVTLALLIESLADSLMAS